MHVVLSPAAQRDLRGLSAEVRNRALAALHGLREHPRPHGCLLLRDHQPPTWRIRVGAWRVLYQIDDRARIVTVTGVRHRGKAYSDP